MPNPIISVGFTPDSSGTAICTANYSVQQTGTSSDWGGGDPGSVMKVTRTSDSVVLYTGPFQPCSRTRSSQVYRAAFPIDVSDGAVTVSLRGSGGATGTGISYWDVDLTVELIKK